MKLIIVLLLLLLLRRVNSYRDDGYDTKCPERKPYPIEETTSVCSSEYIINAEKSDYAYGDAILITVRGARSNVTFNSIYLFAKDENDNLVGRWTTNDPLLCTLPTGEISHLSHAEKDRIEALWHATTENLDNVKIQATIVTGEGVQSMNCYNVVVLSHVNGLRDLENPTAINETTTTTTARPSTTSVTPSPTADVGVNVTWTIDSNNITRVYMSIIDIKPAQWAAVGLSVDGSMGPSHVFICRRFSNDTINLGRYINPGRHQRPTPAGLDAGGAFNIERETFLNGVVSFQFTLSNFSSTIENNLKDIPQLSQSTPYVPIFALGPLDDSNALKQHNDDSHAALKQKVQLNRQESLTFHMKPSTDDNTDVYLSLHGGLMVFTWILLASTGMIFARYFKNAWPNSKICGEQVWFATHRLLMSVAAILTVLAFMFVLVYNSGRWVKEDKERAHAITGVIVIGLAFFQPFMALFRCKPDSPYRFIFNYMHAFAGFVSFALSIAAMFLATINFKGIFTTQLGWIMMIVWTCWIIIICIVFECIHRSASKNDFLLNGTSSLIGTAENLGTSSYPLIIGRTADLSKVRRLKKIFLLLHICVAMAISIVLIIPIASLD